MTAAAAPTIDRTIAIDRRSAGVGPGASRAFLAYLLVLAIGTWLGFAANALSQGAHFLAAAFAGAMMAAGSAIPVLGLLALAGLPAFVAALELGARFGDSSRPRWAALGAGAWFIWAQLVIQTVLTSGVVYLFTDLTLPFALAAGGSGAVFGALAFDGRTAPRPGRLLIASGALVAAVILVGAFVTIGWWGGPA